MESTVLPSCSASRRKPILDCNGVPSELQEAYTELERRIHKACDHMMQIRAKIQDVSVRLERAAEKNREPFVYSYQTQLQVLQGVYNMYYAYCSKKCEELMEMEQQMN